MAHTRGTIAFLLSSLARTSADDTREVVVVTAAGVLRGYIEHARAVLDDHALLVVPAANDERSTVCVPYASIVAFADSADLATSHRDDPRTILGA